MKQSGRFLSVSAALAVLAFGSVSVSAQSRSSDLRDEDSPLEAPYLVTLPADEDEDDDDACNPDPPCFDEDNRFVDCGNGTVTDTVTGVVWLQETTCLGVAYYVEANARAASLGADTRPECNLGDGSCPGDWRLASKEEWEAIMAQAQANGCAWPDIVFPDSEGLGCWSDGDVFHDVTNFFGYLTSTTVGDSPDAAWYADTQFGGMGVVGKTDGCEDIPPGTDCDPFPPIYFLAVRDR